MASTRESSSASEAGSPSRVLLSPNSKIQALLANMDNESDASDRESISGAARARLMKSMKKPLSPRSSKTLGLSSAQHMEVNSRATSSDEEEEEIVAPRGRLAAAMRAHNRSSSSEKEAGRGELEKRVHRSSPAKSTSSRHSPVSDAASEDSDAPVVSRKRKIRTSRRSATPPSAFEEQPASPGLFVSPTKHTDSAAANSTDSDDLPEPEDKDARFKALVEKKRKEMQNIEKAKEARKAAERKLNKDLFEDDAMDMSDGENGRRLTQQAKPTRKASKKAMEELHRETQRLSRNQQLAHYATTKKKFSTKDFIKLFNTTTKAAPTPTAVESRMQSFEEPTSSSPAAHSDVEKRDTPPSSPPPIAINLPKSHSTEGQPPTLPLPEKAESPKLDVTTLESSLSTPIRMDKGKGRAVEQTSPQVEPVKEPLYKHRPVRIRPTSEIRRENGVKDDSDSDLEIVQTKEERLKVKLEEAFNRVPAKKSAEDQGLYALRMFAQVKSPGRRNNRGHQKPSVSLSEMQVSLQRQARQQAAQAREEKLEDLRRRGIIVQTTEEREKEMVIMEDLVSMARKNDKELAEAEKAAAKRRKNEDGEVDPLGDSSDDEDWEEKESIAEEHSEIESEVREELSGSEEEEGEEAGDRLTTSMVDNEASDTEDDGEDVEIDLSIAGDFVHDGDVEEEIDLPMLPQSRRSRNKTIISDDEDESHDELQTPSQLRKTPTQLTTHSPTVPTSVLRSASKTFIPGVTVTGVVGLGLTQIFAGTMDDSQDEPFNTQSQSGDQTSDAYAKNDSMAFLRGNFAPSLPPFAPTMSEEETQVSPNSQVQVEKIPESQPAEEDTQGIQLNFTQSQIQNFDSFLDNSQMSPFPEATQDAGFADMTPIKGRFVDVPVSTVDTLVMNPTSIPITAVETPIVKKKGRLTRRAPQVFSDDEDMAEPVHIGDDLEIDENIFDVMRKASKKKVTLDEFDKKNSKAKEMVEEQANESEDEYAGLGGASDDESDGEADEFVKAMIDDDSNQHVDKGKIAAFFADRERASDEKAIEKLYKDITTGMMRRKRGADYDLSDSDDGGEARRRMKQKDFAKMRKALLADERIGKIAENPKRQAFLRAIEDRGSEDEMDFLEDFPEDEEESQSQSQGDSQPMVPNSQPGDMGPPQRKRPEEVQEAERLPPHLRRTKPAKRPSNISEIRESLSSLIEEPNSFVAPVDAGSDSEDDLEIEMEGEDDLASREQKGKENRDPFALRRTNSSVIDRISLKRESSSTLSNSTRLAFAVGANAPGFKVPALLRRATTNSSVTSNSSVSGGSMAATERMSGGSAGEGVKRGGGKNSGVHYFARETERRAAVAKTEARREKKRFKGVEGRRKAVGGLLGAGKFE